MKTNKIFTSKFIAGVGILTSIEIVLYIIGANISIGGININLALIPIVLGTIIYGPICGLFLGLVNGVCVLLTPFTQTFFMNQQTFGSLAPLATIVVCLLKCSTAGLVAGFIYLALKEKNKLAAVITSSLCVPLINTAIFVIGAALFWNYDLKAIYNTIFTFNFLIEFLGTALLCPAIIRVINIMDSRVGNTVPEKENNNEEK